MAEYLRLSIYLLVIYAKPFIVSVDTSGTNYVYTKTY